MVGVMGSKYLKAAQELLDEVVSVGKGSIHGGIREKGKESRDKIAGKEEEDGGGDGGGGTGGGGDMSTAERQELQMKKAKLVHMLDEVEQRYRQYHHQMQMVVSSFEAVAGFGSAKSYTALALQTISKQFRCLRDAIAAQVRATGKSLGEEDCLAVGPGSKSSMGSRLRFVDHHLRQQRALQQLGMIQHNAWRPQRGLPERAVSVLRAWLFEHFLHPYPKDSDKHMLAKQTGLTRSQVSNWFINARVRLWKPMVEEMYLEETKGQEQSNNNDDDDNNNTTKTSKSEATNHSHSPSKSLTTTTTTTTSSPSVADHHPKPVSVGPKQSSPLPPPLPSSEYGATMMFTVGDPLIQQRMKKTWTSEDNDNNSISSNNNMVHDELSNRELLMKFVDHSGGFGGYPMSEIAHFDHHHHQQQQQQQFSAPRFGGNGAVSLTLGLPHCEYLTNEGIQMSSGENNNNNYFNLNNTNSNNMSHHHPSGSHSTPNVYESISIQNRKRFAAHQLLPDYVA